MKCFLYAVFFQFFICISTEAQQIFLDESFADWQGTSVTSYRDKSGDSNTSGIDITDIKISNDDKYLYVYFNLNKEINLQQNNFITIYIDTDNKTSTGLNFSGIGADLAYYFGPRNGKYYQDNRSVSVFHNDVGFVSSPTVTSKEFEIAIKRSFTTSIGTAKIGDKVSIIISDENIAGDKAPDQNGGFVHTIDQNRRFVAKPYSMQKDKKEYLRIVSYNVLRDRMFLPQFVSAYDRVFKAIVPDIIGFCEIYDNSSAQTAAFVEKILPSVGSQKWYHAGLNPDIRLISRFPILQSRSIDGNGAFLIDLGYSKLVYVVAHLPCCENDVQRQQEIDNIMSFIRGIRFGISPFQVPQNTPVIISGDMNMVGLRQQQKTFTSGDISDNNRYGPDFFPDWDDTDLADAIPFTTNTPFTFTWYNDNGTFSAGRLDYFYYTDAVVDLKNSFSLWTPELSNAELTASGLTKSDSETCSDHLPVVCDFFIKSNISSSQNEEISFGLDINFDGQNITVKSHYKGRLNIYDMSGRHILTTDIPANQAQVSVSTSSLLFVNGIYLCQFVTQDNVVNKKIMVIR